VCRRLKAQLGLEVGHEVRLAGGRQDEVVAAVEVEVKVEVEHEVAAQIEGVEGGKGGVATGGGLKIEKKFTSVLFFAHFFGRSLPPHGEVR